MRRSAFPEPAPTEIPFGGERKDVTPQDLAAAREGMSRRMAPDTPKRLTNALMDASSRLTHA
jgi:hypothetical protein